MEKGQSLAASSTVFSYFWGLLMHCVALFGWYGCMHSPCWKMGNISLGCGGKRNLMAGSFQLRGFGAVWYTYYIGRECGLKLDIYGRRCIQDKIIRFDESKG